ncbi:MAG: IS110 family transposase [Flavobacteriales bacterium]|nr:IS110 family transposase [Flavobacteriales bacterium]MBK8950203.1 IS110 family transposase [Flavobacteriales bacterium]
MKHWIGIDVSKATLDVALLDERGTLTAEIKVENTTRSVKALLRRWTKEYTLVKGEYLACLEPTGYYGHALLEVLVELEIPTWLAHPNDIKQSIGMTRGKSDRVDALRIADYARRFQDKSRLFTADQLKMNKLKQLLSKRQNYVMRKTMHQRQIKDMNKLMDKGLRGPFTRFDKAQIKALDKVIKELEGMIEDTINAEPELSKRFELLKSVEGVGLILGSHLLALTDGFTRFTSPRQLACHAGCAPFENRSGTSIRGRTRVSHNANHTLKALLHVSVVGLIRFPGEFRAYYDRKVAEGKHKMLVFNAMRNKLIHRVCAVIRKGVPYEIRTPLAHVIE